MGHFRAVIQGQRGSASRLGSTKKGISASINGWHSGISVEGYFNSEKNEDVFIVTLTSGSGAPQEIFYGGTSKEIGRFTKEDLLVKAKTQCLEEFNVDGWEWVCTRAKNHVGKHESLV